jgi:phage-related protein
MVADAPKFTCVFYRTASGGEPAREWLRSLSKAARQQVGADLLYVQHFWPTGMPRVRALGSGLHEVRSTAGRSEFRVFFCVRGTTLYILHGIQKKTPKTPAGELAMARARQREVEGV